MGGRSIHWDGCWPRSVAGTCGWPCRGSPSATLKSFMLKYAEDWSYHALAEHLGISHSAVEARLHRARQRFAGGVGGRGRSIGRDVRDRLRFRIGSFAGESDGQRYNIPGVRRSPDGPLGPTANWTARAARSVDCPGKRARRMAALRVGVPGIAMLERGIPPPGRTGRPSRLRFRSPNFRLRLRSPLGGRLRWGWPPGHACRNGSQLRAGPGLGSLARRSPVAPGGGLGGPSPS